MTTLADAKFSSKEIVQLGKSWLSEQISDEGITDLGLEELRLHKGNWEVTLGFSRKKPRLEKESRTDVLVALSYRQITNERVFKVLVLPDKDGSIISLRNRDLD